MWSPKRRYMTKRFIDDTKCLEKRKLNKKKEAKHSDDRYRNPALRTSKSLKL